MKLAYSMAAILVGAVLALGDHAGIAQSAVVPACDRPSPEDTAKAFEWADRAAVTSDARRQGDQRMLWYRAPARVWEEALPVGNGRLGAMVFGGVADECLQLNEDTLWAGSPKDASNPDALAALPEVRRLLFAGQNAEATELAGKTMMGRPTRIQSYQSLGELNIEAPGAAGASAYVRALDLDTAIASVNYVAGGVTFTREMFTSAPAGVIVARFTASTPGALDLKLAFKRAKDARSEAVPGNAKAIRMTGQVNADRGTDLGMRFAAVLLAVNDGGTVSNDGGRLSVSRANAVTFIVAASTNYPGLGRGGPSASTDPATRAADAATRASARSYDSLEAEHVTDYQRFFRRVVFRLGLPPDIAGALPTNERLARFKSGRPDPGLAALYFNFGRYLLISSSRPGAMPANLQGLWAWKQANPWNADFHTNINLQMNYWPAEPAALSELHLPLFDLMDSLVAPGSMTAKTQYNARGWVVHHLTDAWGFSACADGVQGIWPMGAAWLARHPWEHYLFTGDRAFLRDRAWPLMKGAAQFVLDFLVEAPAGTPVAGRLVTNPSHSPENAFFLADGKTQSRFTYAATMDLEIIEDLLKNTVEASSVLGIEPEFRAECARARARLAPVRVSPATGRIMEWVEDYKEVEPNHRHTSHLYALHPASQIDPIMSPALADAARKTLEARGDGGTGWSLAWKINMWARLLDGNHAGLLLTNLLADKTLPNLFDTHPPFQIDGNFGATAAIAEMLLQSHARQDDVWILHLLPARPDAWPDGSVAGLRGRGGFEVSEQWLGGKLTEARVRASASGPVFVKLGAKMVRFELKAGQTLVLDGSLQSKK